MSSSDSSYSPGDNLVSILWGECSHPTTPDPRGVPSGCPPGRDPPPGTALSPPVPAGCELSSAQSSFTFQVPEDCSYDQQLVLCSVRDPKNPPKKINPKPGGLKQERRFSHGPALIPG